MTDHDNSKGSSPVAQIEPKSVKHQKLRFAIFGLTLAAFILAYQLFQKYSVDPTDLLSTNTVGMIAAVETTKDGSQAVIFDASGKKISAPEYKTGITDRDVAWSLDGNRLFFSSDRDKGVYQIFRWNPAADKCEVRTVGSRSKARPQFGPPGYPTDPSVGLIIEGGFVLQMDPKNVERRQLLPPVIQQSGSAEEGSGAQFDAMYKDLGTSFKIAKFTAGREGVVALMRRDSGEVLIHQGFTITKNEKGETLYPRPMPLVAGKRIDFDVSSEGIIAIAVVGAQRVQENFLLQPGEKAPPAPPFTNAVLLIDSNDLSKPPVPVFVANDNNEAAIKPRFSADGQTLFALVGAGSEVGNVTVRGLMSFPAKEAGVKESHPVIGGPISDFDISPAGDKVVYTATVRGKNCIFVVDAAGSEPKKISDDGDYSEPRFSPQVKQ